MPKQSGFSKSNTALKKLPLKKKEIKDKKELLSYLSYEYGITYFIKTFVYKLDYIHNGSLQNLQVPVTYDVLLDMFKHYRQDLNKQRIYNKSLGKIFSDKQGQLNYDLAIVLSKHSDYLLMLEEDRARAEESVKPQATAKLVNNITAQKDTESGKIDINKMLDEW